MIINPGLKPVPSVGSMRTRYGSARFSATFYTHDGESQIQASSDGGKHSDVISGSVFKSLQNPIGGWHMTLAPSQNYLQKINPGDWCQIEMDNGDGNGMRFIMYGPVKSIRRNRSVGQSGIVQTVIDISGADFGDSVCNMSALYDAKLAQDVGFSNLSLLGLIPDAVTGEKEPMTSDIRSPGEMVLALVKRYLSNQLRQLFDPKTKKPFGSIIDTSTIDTNSILGKAPTQAVPLSDSFWQTLQSYANPAVCELFMDYRVSKISLTGTGDVRPSIVLRRYPFSNLEWLSLSNLVISRDDLLSDTLGKSDDDVRNWYRVCDDPSILSGAGGCAVYDNSVGLINADSIKKFGFRRFEPSTQYCYTPGDSEGKKPETTPGILEYFTTLVAEWHCNNEQLLNGQMVTTLKPEARVGYRLDYIDTTSTELFQFYIESVEHNFQYQGPCTTSLGVTRGRSLGAIPSVHVLKTLGTIQEMGGTIDRSLEFILQQSLTL